MGKETLRTRKGMCEVIRPSVLAQEEGGDVGHWRVVSRSDIILEEMEKR
jgi:hypothetical protein